MQRNAYDLLQDYKNLETNIHNKSFVIVRNKSEVEQYLHHGIQIRKKNLVVNFRYTLIFTITIESIQISNNNISTSKSSHLSFVILANSQREFKVNHDILYWQKMSNCSSTLSAIGNVLSSLSNKQLHVPYRDSLLTKFLYPNLLFPLAATLLIGCIEVNDYNETMNTLRYFNSFYNY